MWPMAGHIILPCVHRNLRIWANLKAWALGAYRGPIRPHPRTYLD